MQQLIQSKHHPPVHERSYCHPQTVLHHSVAQLA